MNFFRLVAMAGLAAVCAVSVEAGAPVTAGIGLESEVPASIAVTPIVERWDGRGFMPLRIRMENRGHERLAWNFSLTAGIGYSGSGLRQEMRLAVDAGEVVETVVYVPGTGPLPGGQRTTLTVGLDGPGSRGSSAYLLNGNNETVLPTATTPGLESALFSATNGAEGERTEITAVEPARWPADWRVWSPFRRVVLTDKEFAALDGSRQAALRDWVAMGGLLDLYPAAGRGENRIERHGHGMVRNNVRTLAEEAGATTKSAVSMPTPFIDELRRARLVEISSERRLSLEPGGGTIGIALFLLGFGVVIGPINLFVFAPSGRRHRLFLTVPAISLGASLLLAGYIVVKDGFGGEGARVGTVLLLPESNQAVVTQIQLARTGVLAGAGFDVADDVVMERAGNGADSWDPYQAERARSDHYQRSQGRADGDWFVSRRAQEHTLRRLTPTRARVELVGGGEGAVAPVVQSSVGTALRDFRYVDASGRTWAADEVAPGQRITLARRSDPVAQGAQVPGTFTARGGAAEGLAPIATLAAIRWDEPDFLYVGPLVGARMP